MLRDHPNSRLDQPSCGAVTYSNGDTGPGPQEGRGPKEGWPLRYGAMFSTKENAFLHQADMFARQQHQAGPPLALAKHCLPHKRQSFGAESQDSVDLENTSASNSGSEQRLNNLHQTSSLEVELASSHDDNSSSQDSEGSPVAVGHKWQSDNPEGKRGPDARSERNSNWLREQGKEGKGKCPQVEPPRPLVRTRTFEVIEGAVDCSPCESPAEPRKRTGRGLKHELSEQSSGCVATNSPKRNRAGQGGSGQERKVSEESVLVPYQDGAEDPETLRELERKKGSLIFEHNFQTYSNIPSTNMMTASMMTASLSSESGSVGMSGSLYSSMVDSALLGSIHSLGALEATAADPLPRPASVGLPMIHSTDEPVVEAPQPSRRHVSRSQRSTEAVEIQKITEREEATQTPSPDSLSVDLVAQRCAEATNRTRSDRMEGSTASINKEEMDDEEKERDEQETEGRLGNGSSVSNEPKIVRRELSREESFGRKTISGSPSLSRDLSENTPILSGGSTLKREKDVSGERKCLAKCERQVSIGSVKDVDAIPLVCGYIGPQDEEEAREGGEAKGEDGGETSKDKDEEKHQSIFSMFIDLKDIPSPAEEPKPAEKEAASRTKAPSSAVYMYIEADTPSPKTRRKRRSESDGAAMAARTSESQAQEFASLPPVLSAVPDVKQVENATKKVLEKREEHEGVREECKEGRKGKESKEKKGFFMFIEAESSSNSGSPKTKRRPAAPPVKKPPEGSTMTRSAPSDSILFSSPDTSRLMTKSVIGREEYIAQPPARKNVSLNDKINESSNGGKDGNFVSGIPRPIHTLRAAKSSSKRSKGRSAAQKSDSLPRQRDASATRTKEDATISEANDLATSRDISVSELGPTQSSSLGEVAPSSKIQEGVEDEEAVSDVSSLLSSLDRSNKSSEQGSSEHKSKLGEDLLQMFLNEVNTDVTIQVGEKRIHAHKCILASRCVYFAAMLSGHWVETAGNVIKLQGFSPESVMVALKHIYSGTSRVPEGVRVGELAALADMLALDGLKDVIALHLKAKMCHYFHKPCSGCLEGVLDVLPIAGAYCLDELYHRCLRWVARHFVVVLPTRNYAALPPEVQDRCLKQLLDDMSVGNVLESALGCERVLASLPMVRWAQPVFDSAAQLLESATSFIATNMSGVLASDRFLALGHDSGWSIESLKDTMRVAGELIRPDQAVLSHLRLTQLLQENQEEGAPEVSETYLTFLETLLSQVEKFMVHNANRVAVCRKWPLLSTFTQRRIKDAAMVVVEFSRPTAPRPKLSSATRKIRGSSTECNRIGGRPGDHRLMRSASATAVPSTQRPGTKRTPALGPEPGRCNTPPASLPRPRTHTPPPTRASTLRAQARQVAIQRSQSARSVAEQPRRAARPGNDTSTDEEVQPTTKRTIPTGSFTRGATFTRSLSRPDPSSSRPLPHTPTRSLGPPPSSRPRTPALHEGSQLPRRTSAIQRTSSHTLPRTQSVETRCRTPTLQRTELRSSTNSLSRSGDKTTINNLSRTGGGSTNNLSRTGGGSTNNLSRTGSGTSTNNLSKVGGGSNSLTRSVGSTLMQESKSIPHNQPEGNCYGPRTPRDPRKQIDAKNGNLARPRVAAQGRRSTRSPLRGEPGRTIGLGAGRGSSPTSSIHLSSEGRSRSSSVTSRPTGLGGTTTATPPSVGSRSNTFCKDDNTNTPRKAAIP
ncbi:BTB/POZ domain-containing protein 8 [Chionoecetes opilio]|uniref:BTB/POZ domain-containing protein 8 n=1 Tax=Chionoecetes opilio TaxID=41210 RepID=A0A8J4YEA5_CHIOP|nr:BTB/POZ domain-containing protein 8 [Chionoecetes opilio]